MSSASLFIVPGQNKLSPTFSNDVRSGTTVTTTSISLAALLTSPINVTIGTKQPNSSRNSSSSASRHNQLSLTVPSSVPPSSIGFDRQSNACHPTSFMPATEARSLVSPQREDGVLNSTSTEPHMLSFNSSSINWPTTPSPPEGALEQTLLLTVLLGVLQREQLQEIHAKEGFAGFTVQDIEGWVAADQA